MTKSKYWHAGYKDGLAWDLDGYGTLAEVQADTKGWDEAALQACGSEALAERMGFDVKADFDVWSEDFERALADYNDGAWTGAVAPQEERTGLPPRG